MAGGIFSYTNLVDLATTTLAAGTGVTYQASLPLSNLKDHRVSNKARTTNTTNHMKFTLDFGTSQQIKCIALMGMNFAQNFVADTAPALNAVVIVAGYSNVSPTGFEVGTEVVQYSDWSPRAIPPIVAYSPNNGAGFNVRYVNIETYWLLDTGVTYYEAGRLWVGNAIVLPGGVEEGWQQTIKDNSSIVRSRGGQIYSDIRARYRSLRIEASLLSQAQAIGDYSNLQLNFQEMFLNAGNNSEVLVIPRSGANSSFADNQLNSRLASYGVFTQEPVITNLPGNNYKVQMEIADSL